MSIFFDGNYTAKGYKVTSPSIGTGAWSVCAWIYPITNSVNKFWLGRAQFSSSAYALGESSSDKMIFNSGGSTKITGTTTITNSAWYHLAFTRDGSNNCTLWLDGVSDGTASDATNPPNQLFTLGAEETAGTGWNQGRVCNVLVYDGIALTQAEILAQRPSFLPVRTNNLWAWYPFIIQADSTADYSGNGNTLTANGTNTIADNPPITWRQQRSIKSYTSQIAQGILRFSNWDANFQNLTGNL